jgi:hypothetical protein
MHVNLTFTVRHCNYLSSRKGGVQIKPHDILLFLIILFGYFLSLKAHFALRSIPRLMQYLQYFQSLMLPLPYSEPAWTRQPIPGLPESTGITALVNAL